MTPDVISPESAMGVAGGLAGLAFAMSKFMASWKKDGAEGAGHDAMKSTIDGLAAEIERLGKQNTALAERVNAAQMEIISANDKLIEAGKVLAAMPTECPDCGRALP